MRLFITLLMVLSGFVHTQELFEYKINGPKNKRINVVIVGDGYTLAQRDLFESDLSKVYDAIVSDPMLARYADYHNYYGLYKPSTESGADNLTGCGGVPVNTAYDARYCSNSTDRLLTVNTSKVYADLATTIPEYDMVMVVVNANKYGGSGGAIAVSSSSSPEIIAHEIGHSFPKLKDEYESYYSITPQVGLNVTNTTIRSEIHWNYWIDEGTPLPTPEDSRYSGVVGVFEGAAYQPTGWYRPEYNCRMRTNSADLCAICAEIWALKIHEYVSPIDSVSPNEVSLIDPNMLSVKVMDVYNDEPLDIQWYIDNIEREDLRGQTSWSLDLSAGDYEIWVKVSDTTAYVRKDPENLMEASQVWQVSLSGTTSLQNSLPTLKATFLRADRNGFSWKSNGNSNIRLYNSQGQIYADFQLNSNQGDSKWPRPLSSGPYFIEIADQNGVERRKILIR